VADERGDRVFAGAIPALYDTLLVPLIFAPYAEDIARRVAACRPRRVLESAAGTGVVTRALDRALPAGVEIVASDLNEAMLMQAQQAQYARPIAWRVADALALPFADGEFDVVVCQFGVMFFPDKARGYAQARRVLRPGGAFVFNTWDRIGTSEFADTTIDALAQRFPDDPPRFLARTPHGYHEPDAIAHDLAQGGFAAAMQLETVTERSRADSPRVPAIAYCQGTPLRGEIEARDPGGLAEATDVVAAAIAARFGDAAVDGKIQAHVVTVARD
jgi:SAM-dependent methyltransferase